MDGRRMPDYDDQGLVDAIGLRSPAQKKKAQDRVQARRRREATKPKVICLCGSTRFTAEMLVIQWEFTKAGHIVLSWCALPDNYFKGEDRTHIGDQEGVKDIVDEVHKRKIDLADEVYVLNIDGYIGESTRSEIDHALSIGKPVLYHDAPNEAEGDGR